MKLVSTTIYPSGERPLSEIQGTRSIDSVTFANTYSVNAVEITVTNSFGQNASVQIRTEDLLKVVRLFERNNVE